MRNLQNVNVDKKKQGRTDFIKRHKYKIKTIKDDFILFISTGNSTQFAKKMLEQWWILEYFELVLWSEIVPKTEEHIKIMQNHMNDNSFCEKAIFVWDWARDREIAEKMDTRL